MLKIQFRLLILSLLIIKTSFAATSLFDECKQLEADLQNPHIADLVTFTSKCKSIWIDNATQKYNSISTKIYSLNRSVLVERNTGEAKFLAGITTGIRSVNAITFSEEKQEFFLLDNSSGVILAFSTGQFGSSAPLRVIADSVIKKAVAIQVVDQANQLLVANPASKELFAFNLDGHSYTPDPIKKAKIENVVINSSQGIRPDSIKFEQSNLQSGLVGVGDSAAKMLHIYRIDYSSQRYTLLKSVFKGNEITNLTMSQILELP